MKRQKNSVNTFNKFMNTLKKEREQKSLTDKHPWLDPDDERKHMTDREILEKYINLNNSYEHGYFSFCLFKCRLVGISQEQNQILDCRQAFASFKHGFFQV